MSCASCQQSDREYGHQDMTYQVKNRDFHHTLVEVRCPVLDDLDRDNLLRLQILTLDDLPERALAQHVQNQVPILVPCFLRPEDVVDIEDIVAVLVIVAIILAALARLREDSTWVPRRLVFEARVADAIRRRQMNRQGLEGLS